MTAKERTEHARLQRAWVTGQATKSQIMRCMELDRQAEHDAKTK